VSELKPGTQLWWKNKRIRVPVKFVTWIRRDGDKETASIETHNGAKHDVLSRNLFPVKEPSIWRAAWENIRSTEIASKRLLAARVHVESLIQELARAGQGRHVIDVVLEAARRIEQKEMRVAS
jgi:hypothetical protein